MQTSCFNRIHSDAVPIVLHNRLCSEIIEDIVNMYVWKKVYGFLDLYDSANTMGKCSWTKIYALQISRRHKAHSL